MKELLLYKLRNDEMQLSKLKNRNEMSFKDLFKHRIEKMASKSSMISIRIDVKIDTKESVFLIASKI